MLWGNDLFNCNHAAGRLTRGLICLLLILGCSLIPAGITAGRASPSAGSPEPVVLTSLARVVKQLGVSEDACLDVRQKDSSTPQRSQLSRLVTILSLSPLAADALQMSARRGTLVCFDAKTENMAYYIAGLRVIALQPALTEGARVAFLTHELAHVPQHPRYSDNRYFPVEDLVLLRRAREAAAEAASARMLWQLRRVGYEAGWREKAKTGYRDILNAFAAAMPSVPTPHSEAIATRAAYDRWFERPYRVNQYDAMTVSHVETIAVDDMGLVPPRRFLTDYFLRGIGELGRDNYLAFPHHRALAGKTYRRGLSEENFARLERALDPARLAADQTLSPPQAAARN